MEGLTMDGRNGENIRSPHDMFGRFTAELTPQIRPWQQSLSDQPADLESIEKAVHQAFARGADMMVAGLIAATIASEPLQKSAAATRKQFSQPLQKGRARTIAVRLLGGLMIWATTLYCAPKKKRFARDDSPRVGLDITLAQFGFGKGVSPGLQSRVARSVALCPSIAFAHQ